MGLPALSIPRFMLDNGLQLGGLAIQRCINGQCASTENQGFDGKSS